jgi:hypothetical protein
MQAASRNHLARLCLPLYRLVRMQVKAECIVADRTYVCQRSRTRALTTNRSLLEISICHWTRAQFSPILGLIKEM